MGGYANQDYLRFVVHDTHECTRTHTHAHTHNTQVSGQSMIRTIADLSVFYLAAVQALAVSLHCMCATIKYREVRVLCGSTDFHLPLPSLFEPVYEN